MRSLLPEVRQRDARVHGHRGEPLLGAGLDEVRSVDGRGHGAVHEGVLFDKVEIFVVQ